MAEAGVGMSSDPDEYVTAGGEMKYWVSAGNYGPDAVTGVGLTDNFPAKPTNCSWECTQASNGATCIAGVHNGNLTDTIDLPFDSWVVYRIVCTVDPPASGTIVNTATITLPVGFYDPDTTDHVASLTHTIIPLHLDVSGSTVTTDETYVAAQDILAGNFMIQAPNGKATMLAGEKVIFGNDVTVETGCELTVEIDSSLVP